MFPNEINGYKVVALKFDENSKFPHYLYIKRHSVREKCEEKPNDRTLFVMSVPPYCTEESLKNAFSKYGNVLSVFIHSKPTSTAPPVEKPSLLTPTPRLVGFKVAYIVFDHPECVENAMHSESNTVLILSTSTTPLVLGLTKWCNEYNSRRLDPDLLKIEIDGFMKEYDTTTEEKKKIEKAAADPDNEGWTLVTRRGKRPGFSRKESVSKRIMAKEERKRPRKELLNFYRFQIKESKKNQLLKLRQKFEEDKKKIEILKQARKFRPFK